jgi:arylsulfatase A-like enzyme
MSHKLATFKKITTFIFLFWAFGSIAQTKNDRPNILFILADDASFAHFSAYGSTWVKTPAFDEIAKNGLLFNKAYTPNAKCGPSRACILTGRNSWQLEELANHNAYWPVKYGSVFEDLKDNGYATGYTGKSWAPGVAGKLNGKPREVTGKAYQSKKLVPPTKEISDNDYEANFKDFLNEKNDNEPFAFWFGCWEPHRAYEYGTGAKLGLDKNKIDNIPPFYPDVDSVRNDFLDYAFELQYFDAQIAKMLKVLKDRNLLDNTIVIVTSDNGMPFPRIKGQEYEFSNHLPLAIMWNNGIKNTGRKIDDYVSFIDFAPTFLELARVPKQARSLLPVQGKSLLTIFNSNLSKNIEPQRDHVLIGKERHDIGRPNDEGYPIRGIIKGQFIYLRNFMPDRWPSGNPEMGYPNVDGGATKSVIIDLNRKNIGDKYWLLNFGKRNAEELYNIVVDPYCMTNLANNPKFLTEKKKLKSQLFTELRLQKDPRILGSDYIFDHYTSAENTGFYEKYINGIKVKTSWYNLTDFETNPLIINYYQPKISLPLR